MGFWNIKQAMGLDAQIKAIQWNLSITTTSKIKFITFDLFSNVF